MNNNNLIIFIIVATIISLAEGASYCTSASGNSLKIAHKADDYVGSTKWAYASKRRTGANTEKDYIFVAEVIEWAKASVPHRHWYSWSPVTSSDWSNPNDSDLKSSGCWSRVTSCYKTGDVIAGNRHVGIITGEGKTTHAARNQVVEDNWGLGAGDKRVIWRYKC